MKITTKILSLVLVICMMLSVIGYADTYSDVSDTASYYSAVNLLSSLGIIKGYEDGTFGPERNVTRAEFTVMLMRTLGRDGIGSSDPAGLPFEDVASVDWAVSDIRTAYDSGIINGMSATEFAPQADVTAEQALKMIVCALGYEPMAIDIAGGADKVWPAGYTTVASNLGINTGVKAALTEPAKRFEIAMYIYNCLETDIMQSTTYSNGAVRTEIKEGTNILNNNLKVYYGTGELRSDSESSVEASGTVSRKGEVLIYQYDEGTNDTFIIPDTIKTTGLVGRSIKYYYTENNAGEKTLVHIEDKTKSSSVVTIDPADIDRITGSWASGVEIEYWENDTDRNTTKVEIAENPVITVNGRVVSNSSLTPSAAFTIDSGSIELVDTENSGNFTKVNIVSYQTYVIDSVVSSTKTIVDMYRTATDGNSYVLDESDVQTTLTMKRAANNSTASLSSLSKYNVLSIKESSGNNGKKIIDVIVSTESVSGTVTSIDRDAKEISVDKKTYTLSNYILNYAKSEVDKLSVNDTCKFYLDKDGNIAAYEKTTSNNTAYAYICGAAKENDDTIAFRVYEASGARTSLKGASRVKIDGEPYSDADRMEDVLTKITKNIDGKGINGSQLVKISKNSSGQVTAIDTEVTTPDDDDSNLKKALAGTKFKYSSSNKEFTSYDDSNVKFRIDSSTIIFSVPTTRTDYSNYTKRSLSYFKDGKDYSNIEVFDVGTGSAAKAKCIVIYGGGTAEGLTADSPVVVVNTNTSTTYANENVRNINGYIFSQDENSGTQTVSKNTTTTSKFDSAVKGDVFRVAYTDGSRYNSYSEQLVSVKGSSMGTAYYKEGVTGNADNDYIAVYGLLVGVDEDTFVIAKTNDINDLIEGKNVETYSFNADSNTTYLTYDASENTSNMLTASNGNIMKTWDNFDASKTLITKDDAGNITSSEGVVASEVFAYIVEGKVLLVYQIVR